MKKKFLIIPILILLSIFVVGCNSSDTKEDDVIYLNVYNCADYICEDYQDEETGEMVYGVLYQFEEYCKNCLHKNVKVKYSTYETNEDLYNQLKAGGVQYDLVCPSEYMIGKMLQNDMLEKLTHPIENYEEFGSRYIKGIFDNISDTNKVTNELVSFKDYAVPYMWGTMGFMYDPANLTDEDVSSWSIVWDKTHPSETSLKDSIRDTYAVAALYVYEEELNMFKELFDEGIIDADEYNLKVTEIMNRCDDKTLVLIEAALKDAKKNVYEFEVDTGKENIVNGKYYANVCWSGDAVYAMDQADENDFTINYMIPTEGSNVWFDGWVMPKGANVELAQELMNFLCDPSIAAQNMDYIGYTSAIAGQEIWELACEWYDEVDDDGCPVEGSHEYDITYFFEGTEITDSEGQLLEHFIINTTEEHRQLYCQYPDLDTIKRCAVMKDFGPQLEKVNEMWISVKGNSISWVIALFIAVVVVLVIFFEVKKFIAARARKSRTIPYRRKRHNG